MERELEITRRSSSFCRDTGRGAGDAEEERCTAYRFDGDSFAISTRAPTQKAKNISVRPEVSLAVIDGQKQLIVYGAATIVRDEAEVLRLHKERIRKIALRQETDEELAERLRREQRGPSHHAAQRLPGGAAVTVSGVPDRSR